MTTTASDGAAYQTRPYAPWRLIMSDALRVAKEKNYVHGLVQADVTEARRLIHAYEARTGGDFSFTAFLVACVAQAVGENKAVHALRKGSRLILFDDVDVGIQVEHDVSGQKVVSGRIIRAANHKSARQIHDEIRAAQREHISGPIPVNTIPSWIILAARLPGFLRRFFLRRILNDPFTLKRMGGTVNLTAFGMAGKGGGWGIAIGETSLTLAIGGIEPVVKCIDGQFCVREMLSITLGFDHDVIDGAPAARFTARMKALIEEAHGLETLDADAVPT
jgi:pyruvate/2-oxoglutarate dehydrogenase complex dihydrolipoamide acyltransferase (E2) component